MRVLPSSHPGKTKCKQEAPVAARQWCPVQGAWSRYFSILNAMALFVLFGIGCDDIFVIAARWRRSEELYGEIEQLAERVEQGS